MKRKGGRGEGGGVKKGAKGRENEKGKQFHKMTQKKRRKES